MKQNASPAYSKNNSKPKKKENTPKISQYKVPKHSLHNISKVAKC